MKMKMFLLALPCSALLILGASSLIAFADELPCLACAEVSRGQIIFIGGINFITRDGAETVETQFTLYNPNRDEDIIITDIRVIDPDGTEPALDADLLPFITTSATLPKTLPALNSTIETFGGMVTRGPTLPPTIRSQVLFTWVSASGSPVLPLKITGLEFRTRSGTTQIGRNTTQPHLILELEDNDDDDDDD